MPFILEIVTGSRAGQALPLTPGKPVYVGRHETAHVRIADDPLLANAHFVLESDRRGCRIRAMSSQKGTFVNGAKVSEQAVRPGDRIEAGATAFVLREESADGSVPTATPAPAAAPSPPPTVAAPRADAPRPAPPPSAAPPLSALSAELLELHREELESLWARRQGMLKSPHFFPHELAALERRVEAHVQGMLVIGPGLVHALTPELEADAALPVFLAAYPLLRHGSESAVRVVLDAFVTAQEGQLDGLRDAFCHAGLASPAPFQKALTSAPASVGVAAAEVLAFHGRLQIQAKQFDAFLKHEDPLIRKAAWRTAARTTILKRPDASQGGFKDSDADVQREALWASAWQGHPGLLDHCRQFARKPTPEQGDALHLLAILGKPADVSLIQKIAQTKELGPRRFDILASFGHPDLVDLLLAAMDSPDIPTMAAAAGAFTRITGLDIESNERVQVPPADGHKPDDFEKEFLDEAKVPNRRLARDYWKQEAARYRKGTRWARGLNVSEGLPEQGQDSLDLKARWEACLRGKFQGTWKGNLSDLERFPQT